MFNLILFGPPGAGKGTQSKNIIEKYGFLHISTGDILRREINEKTALGLKVKEFMDKGALVPDEVLLDILHQVYSDNQGVKGFVWDGFPRTLVQARALDHLLEAEGSLVSLVIALSVDQDELVRRVWKRSLDQGRSDDKEDIILERFRIYKEQTMPLIEYYKDQGKFECIQGMEPIDTVFGNICSTIDRCLKY